MVPLCAPPALRVQHRVLPPPVCTSISPGPQWLCGGACSALLGPHRVARQTGKTGCSEGMLVATCKLSAPTGSGSQWEQTSSDVQGLCEACSSRILPPPNPAPRQARELSSSLNASPDHGRTVHPVVCAGPHAASLHCHLPWSHAMESKNLALRGTCWGSRCQQVAELGLDPSSVGLQSKRLFPRVWTTEKALAPWGAGRQMQPEGAAVCPLELGPQSQPLPCGGGPHSPRSAPFFLQAPGSFHPVTLVKLQVTASPAAWAKARRREAGRRP